MRKLFLPILILFFVSSVLSAQDRGKEGSTPSPKPGELVFKGDDKTIRRPVLLGTQIGAYKIRDIDLSLNVLRATAPDKLKPGMADHIFNVVLTDKDGKPVKNEKVALVITRDKKKQLLDLFLINDAYYQGKIRLDQPGKYQVGVELRSQKEPESTPSFLYEYQKPKPASPEGTPSEKPKSP